jgi:KUP system potassium uptake protein
MASSAAASDAAEHSPGRRSLLLAALGVVFGDIGTSPLYAFKQCFDGPATVDEARVLGVLSLIAWALILVVTVKYVVVILRADNKGEGGVLALAALAQRATSGRWRAAALMAGLLGAALFYGDGVLTPAISVLSAVEGLEVAAPGLKEWALPVATALLIGLFLMQRSGTERVGGLFGPIIVLWFLTLAALGLSQIVQSPAVLWGLSPHHGLLLLAADPWLGFTLLGAVVLAVTGAEALYADMGHFGPGPIRQAWLRLVLPALLINYFGQGALVLANPAAIANPFYRIAPGWAVAPLIVLAAAATIIASQAVISGAFSMTRQAVQLGYLPRLEIRHTSEHEIGQVYVPRINGLLLVAVILVVLYFETSDALASAYGVAVTGTMTVTTLLAALHFRSNCKWPLWRVATLFAAFAVIDLAFLGANLLKLADGGWLPLAMGGLVYAAMRTWMHGRARIAAQRARGALALDAFIARLQPGRPVRVPGTAVYLTSNVEIAPAALLHNLKHNKVLHERNVLMRVATEDVPKVAEEERIELGHHDKDFHTLVLRYGFMEEPDVLRALAQCRLMDFRFNLMETSFFVGRERIVPRRTGRFRPGKRLFVLLSNTMLDATEFFRIPPNRVVELGGQFEL